MFKVISWFRSWFVSAPQVEPDESKRAVLAGALVGTGAVLVGMAGTTAKAQTADSTEDEPDDVDDYAIAYQLYDRAVRMGAISTVQFIGLGYTELPASAQGELRFKIERYGWLKGLVLNSDDHGSILVTAIMVGDTPIAVGSAGAPLSLFKHDSTRFGIAFGRRFLRPGDEIVVTLANLDEKAKHGASGVVCPDEVSDLIRDEVNRRLSGVALSIDGREVVEAAILAYEDVVPKPTESMCYLNDRLAREDQEAEVRAHLASLRRRARYAAG